MALITGTLSTIADKNQHQYLLLLNQPTHTNDEYSVKT
jgi:hypothetical protein